MSSESEQRAVEAIDIKKSIDEGTSRVNIDDLAKKGIQRVKVINKQTIFRLIDETVQRVIASKTNLLSKHEREEILDRSKEELNRLIKEQKAIKDKADIAEQDKNDLVKEVMNLNEQIRVMQKMHMDEMARRYEDGVQSQQSLVDELKNEIEKTKRNEESRNTELIADMSQRFDEGVQSQQVIVDKIQSELDAVKNELQANKSKHLEELSSRFEEGMKSQQPLIDELRGENTRLKNNSDLTQKEEGQNEKEFIRQRLEELGKSDNVIAENMEALFNKMSENLSEKISQIQVTGGGGKGDTAYTDMPAVSLENIFKEELESNLVNFDVKKETSNKKALNNSLSRLKQMRGIDEDE